MVAEDDIIQNPIDEIEFLEYRVAKRKLDIETLDDIISDKKDEMFMEVEAEYEDDKKNPLLSNADKRKIVVKKRLLIDPSYQKADDDLFDLREIQMVDEIRLRAMKRQYIRDYCQVALPI
jgi:hypothetical protein